MKKLLFPLLLTPFFAFSQIPTGYYNGTAGLTGYALKSKIHEIISANKYTYHYGDLEDFYAQTDLDSYYENNGTILDIYSENPTGVDAYEYTPLQMTGQQSAEGNGWNREHMMPQSTYDGNYPMYSDLFYVIPTDARINQLRSNYPYGIGGTTNYYTFTNGSKINKNGTPNSPYTGRVYEPIDEFKGDVARSMLYFVVRYEDKLANFEFDNGTNANNDKCPLDGTLEKGFEDWYLDLMIQWHNADPVSQREIDRNNIVYTIQKNRNPFIDHPNWVNLIWTQTPDAIVPNAATNLTVSQTNAHFVQLDWTASSSADVIGYKIYEGTNLIGNSKTNSFIADHLTPSTSYNFKVVAYDNGYLESADSNIATATTLSTDSFASDLMITKYLEGSSNNKAMEITNNTGHVVDLKDYGFLIQYYSGSNYYFSGGKYELDGTINHGETIVVIHPEANFSCYNVEDARFITNAPQLTFSGNNYLEFRYKGTVVEAIGVSDQNNSATLGNVSLYRKTTTQNPASTFAIAEWDSYPQNYCQNLGTLSSQELYVTNEKELNIYPNPVNEKLFVKGNNLNKIKTARIFDMSGRVVKEIKQPFKNDHVIRVQDLKTGNYILSLDEKSFKFIKR